MQKNTVTDEEQKSIAISSLGTGLFFTVLFWAVYGLEIYVAVLLFFILSFIYFYASIHSLAIRSLLLEPKKIFRDTEGLQERNLDAILKRRTVSDFLEYRTYKEEKDFGFYTMRSGRKGFVLRVHPGAFVGKNVEAMLTSALETVGIEGTVANFFTFASRNIEAIVKKFEEEHLKDGINVKHPEVLHDMIRSRARFIRKSVNTSMLDGVDFRVRDFINTVSFSFPPETTDRQLRTYYSQIKGSISELHPENFSGRDMIVMVKEILSPEIDTWDSPEDYSIDMATQMTSEGTRIRTTESGDITIGDGWYARAVTTKNFPESISLTDFSGLFFDRFGTAVQNPIPCPFMVSLTIVYENVENLNSTLAKRAAWNIKETNKLDSTIKDSHPELNQRAEEARLVTEYQANGEVPLKATWSLVIMDNDKDRLEEYYSKAVASFRKQNWALVKESFGNIALMSMMSMLPLNDNKHVRKILKRDRILFLSNNTQIAPLISDASGTEPILIYVARSGQLQGWNPYSSDTNYNMVSAGESGSGKSYAQNDIHSLCLAAGFTVRGIDAGHSYKYLNMNIGGQYIEFGEGSNMCLNFFTKIILQRKMLTDDKGNVLYDENEEPIETDEIVQQEDDKGVLRNVIHVDEYKTIIPIIGQMGGVNLAATSSQNSNIVNSLTTKFIASSVEKAIQTSYWQQGKNAGMETVYRSLSDQIKELGKVGRKEDVVLLSRFLDGIAAYCLPSGMFYSYFNGPNNINFNSSYVIAELDELANKGDLYNVVLMSFAQTVMAEFFGERDTKKIFFVDEAWMVFDKPIVVAFLNDLYRRIRKYNGIAITITQGIQDFFQSKMTEAMYNNANWKYFLQIGANGIDQVASGNNVSITPFMAKILKSTRNNKALRIGEAVIFSEKQLMISRIKVDPLSHFTFAGMSPQEKPKMDMIVEDFGVSIRDAIKIAALGVEHNVNTQEAYKLLKGDDAEKLGDLQRKEQLEKTLVVLEDAITMDRVVIFSQTIKPLNPKENNYVRENYIRIIKEDRTVLSPVQFLEDSKELNLYEQLSKIVITKTFEAYQDSEIEFSLNFSLTDIKNQEIISHLLETISATSSSNRFIIELIITNEVIEDITFIEDFITSVKAYNVRVAFDDLGMKNCRLDQLIKLDLDFIKLENSLIRSLDKSDEAKVFVETIVNVAKYSNIQIVAVHVERESTVEMAKSLGIDYIQGYLIDKPKLLSA